MNISQSKFRNLIPEAFSRFEENAVGEFKQDIPGLLNSLAIHFFYNPNREKYHPKLASLVREALIELTTEGFITWANE